MNRRAIAGRAITLLVACMLIALTLIGGYYAFVLNPPKTASRAVQASLEGLETSGRLLLFLRAPAGDATAAELLVNGKEAAAANVLSDRIQRTFGDGAACRLSVDGEPVRLRCSAEYVREAARLAVRLPDKDARMHAVVLEVAS